MNECNDVNATRESDLIGYLRLHVVVKTRIDLETLFLNFAFVVTSLSPALTSPRI